MERWSAPKKGLVVYVITRGGYGWKNCLWNRKRKAKDFHWLILDRERPVYVRERYHTALRYNILICVGKESVMMGCKAKANRTAQAAPIKITPVQTRKQEESEWKLPLLRSWE